jgi:hypothetical protein
MSNRFKLPVLFVCGTIAFSTIAPAQSNPNPRTAYRPVELSRLAAAKLVGSHPATPIFEAFNPSSEQQSAQLDLRYPDSKRAIAILTLNGLQDDSVRDQRYRVELVQQGSVEKPQWKIVWAGQQFRCQRGRGQQTWSSQLCR